MNYQLYQTSVFSIEARLKEGLLRDNYFKLEEIKNLRFVDKKGIIRKIRKKLNINHRNFARLLGTSERSLDRWETGERAIPYEKFLTLASKFKVKSESKIKDCYFSLGSHRGGYKIKLPLKPIDFLLARYLVPHGKNRVYVVKATPQKLKEEIIKNFKIDQSAFKKLNLITIYSQLLNKFLRTFYTYERKNKLEFPLTKEVSEWKDIDLRKAIIIPCLLTDGGEKPSKRLCFFGASERLHNIWTDAMFYLYGLYPSSYLLNHRSIYDTTHFVSEKILSELKKICPNFKTCPAKYEISDYLKKIQPDISYLFKSKKLEQQIAIRIWASTEGNVGINLDKETKLINPILKISCAHPILIKQLQFICKKNGIKTIITKDNKKWNKYDSIVSKSISSIINFLRAGSFIKNVEIAKSRSRYFGGLDKQDVLLGIFEFMNRQRRNKKYRVNSRTEAYRFIRKIVINKEFKNRYYYIKLFGKDFDNWSFRRNKCL